MKKIRKAKTDHQTHDPFYHKGQLKCTCGWTSKNTYNSIQEIEKAAKKHIARN